MKTIAAFVLLAVSLSMLTGCYTRQDIKRIESWQKHDYKQGMLDSANTNERINLYGERWRELEARVAFIEKALSYQGEGEPIESLRSADRKELKRWIHELEAESADPDVPDSRREEVSKQITYLRGLIQDRALSGKP